MSAPTKGFVISLIAVLAAFGVYFLFLAKKDSFIVDNPTTNTFYFKINNGAEKTITAGQNFSIDLNKGKNNVQVFNAGKKLIYDSSFTVNKNRGLLNIAHQDYYINEQFYGYGLNKDSLIAARKATEIDGKNYLNSPKHFNKLYTEDFYFNINEEYDQVIKNIQKIESRSKIFRKQDYLNYYKEYYQF